MNRTTYALYAASLSALLAFASPVAFADSHNLLKDAGFELRLAADEGGWRLFDESAISSDQARNGSQSMFNGGLSKTVAYHPYFVGTVSGSYQEFPAEPGSRWRLVGYGFTPTALEGTPAFGIVQVSFFDADGKDLGTVETEGSTTSRAKLSNEVNSQSPAGEWIFLDTGIATAPAGATRIHAFTLYVDFSGSDLAQGVYFDDLALCVVDGDDDACGE